MDRGKPEQQAKEGAEANSSADRRRAGDGARSRGNGRADLLDSVRGAKAVARTQAYLSIGAAIVSLIGLTLPHGPEFNAVGIVIVDAVAIAWGVLMFWTAGRVQIPVGLLRTGPLLATLLTSVAVYSSGDAASGYALFYVWVGLFIFYFQLSRLDVITNVVWAVFNYAVVIYLVPSESADYYRYALILGTMLAAAGLLAYARNRVIRLLNRLTKAARTDPLTQLPNRVALVSQLEEELEEARDTNGSLSLLVLDVDRFKRVNEYHGLARADQSLRQLAAALTSWAREGDFVSCSGGQEFSLILPGADSDEALAVAERMLEKIRETFVDPDVEFTASIGIASYPAQGRDLATLTAAADQALHAAKALGRDRVTVYSEGAANILALAASRREAEEKAYIGTVLNLAEALDQRDPSTANHSQTVGRLCEMMARELGFEEQRVQRVKLGGILHDIGKIGVPDAVLQKPAKLTDEEYELMKRHPEIGARILTSSELDDVRVWISAHHERPDGRGYPRGLEADEIPVEASILSVGDAYEAMIANRVYRKGMPPEEARAELRRCEGTQFEPEVVDALLRGLDREAGVSEEVVGSG